MKKLILRINGKSLNLFLKETETAEKIYNAVPINSSINTWGEEIYFNTNLLINRENEAKAVVDFGEIAFWTEGSAIAIGYGKTPVSIGQEIRLIGPCNVWADCSFKKSDFDDVKSDDEISLDWK